MEQTQDQPFESVKFVNDGKHHVLLAASGSVATIKLPDIAQGLANSERVSIRIIVTQSAARFLQGQNKEQPHLRELLSIEGVDGIYRDEDEWSPAWTRDAPILHIELRRWADVMLIAPLSANTMAKMAGGITDNLLLSVVRAWNTDLIRRCDGTMSRKRIYVAPAMNVHMWNHPVTSKHLKVLTEDWGVNVEGGWIEVISPIYKQLACGDEGFGAMEEWYKIVEILKEHLQSDSLQPFISAQET